MPQFNLQMAAELEGATLDLSGVTRWAFHVQCTHCRFVNPQPVYLEPGVKHEVPGSRGTANFIMRCKECKYTGTIDLLEQSSKQSRPVDTVTQSNEFVTGEAKQILSFV